MTEKDWVSAYNLIGLDLSRLAPKQFRKWRLFGVACCRRAMAVTPDERLESLAVGAEQFADGLLTWEEVKEIRRVLPLMRREFGRKPIILGRGMLATLEGLSLATSKTHTATLGAARAVQAAFWTADANFGAVCHQEEMEQVPLLRDIFGNPFRPVTFSPSWRTDTAVALARTMYESRDFSAMPILADALQDAGCDNEDILAHCRDAQQIHVRGCWVVDLVLGKE
jgi:hypothetical protein